MIFINTQIDNQAVTVFAVSTYTTAYDWISILQTKYPGEYSLTDEPHDMNLCEYAPSLYSKYRRHVLYSQADTKPCLVVVEGGLGDA